MKYVLRYFKRDYLSSKLIWEMINITVTQSVSFEYLNLVLIIIFGHP